MSLWGLAVLSGLLQVLPFPIAGPVPIWRTQICWVAIVPLLWALLGREGGKRMTLMQGALLGYVSGFFWYLGSCYWIFQTMNLYGGLSRPIAAGILVLFCLYVGLYHALFGGLVAMAHNLRLGRQGTLLLIPFLWVATELARSQITGFPWDLLGVTQVDNPALRQLAPWTGVGGLSFVIAAVNALWLLRIRVRERRWIRPALAVAGVAIVAGYTLIALHPDQKSQKPAELAYATLLQENLDVGAVENTPKENEDQLLRSFSALSRQPSASVLLGMPDAVATRSVRRGRITLLQLPTSAGMLGPVFEPTDLIVWPESPAPFREGEPAFRDGLSSLARQMDAPIIVGNIGVDQQGSHGGGRQYASFNSASFVRPDGTFAGRYDKMHLVPFGEYVPYKQIFFFAGSLLDQVGTFQPGSTRKVFRNAGHAYGTFICYESIFGDEVRDFSKMGADVLVNISNDGWYGDTSAPWQHLNMVRMRAIESHRWILRATNTGITSVINPDGQVVAAAPRHIRTAIKVPFAYEHDVTFYAAHGDLLPWGCALVSFVAVGLAARSKRTNDPGSRVA